MLIIFIVIAKIINNESLFYINNLFLLNNSSKIKFYNSDRTF